MELVFYNTQKIVLEEKEATKDQSGWIRLVVTEKGQDHFIDLFGEKQGKPLEILQEGSK